MPYVNPMRSRQVGVLGSAAIRSNKNQVRATWTKEARDIKTKVNQSLVSKMLILLPGPSLPFSVWRYIFLFPRNLCSKRGRGRHI